MKIIAFDSARLTVLFSLEEISPFYIRDGRIANISSFTMFTDGVVIDASITDDAEHFWADLSQWLLMERRFRYFVTPPRLRFVSQVIVEFDKSLSDLIRKFELIAQALADKLGERYTVRVCQWNWQESTQNLTI
jgi:hypothetical protein